MAKQEDVFKKVISHAKEYGFIFPSSEIYDGLSAVYDYGQNGAELKNNIKQYWWKAMVQLNENIVGIDSAILMHPTTWKASGHVDAFNDPLIDNKDSKKRFRADVLVEDYCAKIEDKENKEIEKAAKRFGEAFDKDQFVATNPKVLEYRAKREAILSRLAKSLENEDLADVKALIEELEIADPDTGSKNWTEVRQFNLMFGTKLGASADSAMDLYLRPETAQGIFVNYLNVQKTSRHRLPFGIAQIGKAFRNEIVARQFIFRMREFEQMEMQFFVAPGTELEFYEQWKQKRLNWHLALGLGNENYRFHDHEKLAIARELDIRLERNSPVPLYYQLARSIEQAITSGELAPGDRLENELSLTTRLGLSRPTARQAIQELVNKGLLVRKRGVGTQVVRSQFSRDERLTSLNSDLVQAGKVPSTQLLSYSVGPLDPDVASALDASDITEQEFIKVRRLRLADDVPLAILTNYLPASFELTREILEQRSLYATLQSLGVNLKIAHQRISARLMTDEEAELLDEDAPCACLTVDRITYDDTGRFVEFGRHVYRAAQYSIQSNLMV